MSNGDAIPQHIIISRYFAYIYFACCGAASPWICLKSTIIVSRRLTENVNEPARRVARAGAVQEKGDATPEARIPF
jgi:hypothetical protein